MAVSEFSTLQLTIEVDVFADQNNLMTMANV
jgi:hypothetical protein